MLGSLRRPPLDCDGQTAAQSNLTAHEPNDPRPWLRAQSPRWGAGQRNGRDGWKSHTRSSPRRPVLRRRQLSNEPEVAPSRRTRSRRRSHVHQGSISRQPRGRRRRRTKERSAYVFADAPRTIRLIADDGPESRSEPGEPDVPTDGDALRCSFCGKGYAGVGSMVCGPTPSVAICNECVELCTQIMAEERGDPTGAA